METRAAKAKVIAAERAQQIKQDDNLKIEGSLSMQRRGTITLSSNKETSAKKEDNLKMEGSFEARTSSSSAQKTQLDTSLNVSTSNLSTSSVQKSNLSSGISSAINQTGKEVADISAISKDKFVSSLRESNGVNIAQTKEMSVIDHHRKQSLQNQKRETWDTRATGYSVGEAHTGRTAAHGGRDYEYSVTAAQSRAAGSSQAVSRQSQSSWSAQEQQSSSSRMMTQEQSSSSRMASATSQHRASISAQHMSSSSSSHQQSSSLQQSASSRASRQDHLGLAGFKQEQVSGFARNLGTSQSGSALIKSDQVIRHETGGSSAYQSVAQQSYRGQQAESRSSQGGSRRRTWAESSMMHGGAAAIGQSIYAQDFHQHSCPASKVYTNTSPYKYERQSSSGHKLFKERENR